MQFYRINKSSSYLQLVVILILTFTIFLLSSVNFNMAISFFAEIFLFFLVFYSLKMFL